VHILAGASGEALQRHDQSALTQLSEGLFADEDVVFVRFTGPDGVTVYEHLEPNYGKLFEADRKSEFTAYYAKQINRDVEGVMHDLAGQKERMAQSRYRDLPQRWNDAVNQITALFVKPTVSARPESGTVLYQEALRTAEHTRDGAVTYAFGTVPSPNPAEPSGAVVVAFSMARTNDSIRSKYLKGLGMVLFFVALILVQNVSARHDKLRLLDLEQRYARAKQALRDALPAPIAGGVFHAAGALDQAPGIVDGQLFAFHLKPDGSSLSALLVDPDGEGVDAAATALRVQRAFLQRCEQRQGPLTDLLGEARILGEVASEIPLARPLGLMLVHVEAGALSALLGPIGVVQIVSRHAASNASAVAPSGSIEAPPGVVGPMSEHRLELAPGESALLVSHGLDDGMHHTLDMHALTGFIHRTTNEQAVRAPEVVGDVASWARGRFNALARHDLVVVAISRAS
jgi:hypothetical protein